MAKADDGITTDRMLLGAAKACLVEGYGSPQIADELLREEGTAGRLPWGYLRKNGDAADDEFWHSARINFEENSARLGYTLFFVGPGVGRDDRLHSTEYLGIWVSRAHVLALLPEDSRQQKTGAAAWIAAEAGRMTKDGEIPAGIKITDFARLLAHRMNKAAIRNRSIHPIAATSIKNKLRDWGLWPVILIK
jgi:hypothetical protein